MILTGKLRSMSGSSWVVVTEIPGGQLVRCRICRDEQRRGPVKRTFMATNTNYAEALAVAESFAAEHIESAEHHAAVDRWHEWVRAGRPDQRTDEERHLDEIFRSDPPAVERACRVCGCTDERACRPPCWWVEADLCSACRDG